ncbi:MAG: CDP-alcohol phosphatidyltransferase family protein [Flavobacteriaceae bacterium]|nr:CDP-alcohol phosphatidyltransferase family protein [Flavobacteriaceae bacterium]MCY4217545.1 CDP-alcohol phosphatidyltransferase family protein [Flavobacteriaceae bacterium]MCY4254108.1 CDP-alcohol phosphatidyltransferase family protein [Flavobacteriaceae bacterium]
MKSQSIFPNSLTLLNLFFGCIACVFSFWGVISGATICLLLCVLFDFLDGSLARRLNSQSLLGKYLDALADLVSFGVTPAIVLHVMYTHERLAVWNKQIDFDLFGLSVGFQWLPLSIIPFLITLCVAFRLARFGSSDNQKESFIGLPSPALALLIVPFPLLLQHPYLDFFSQFFQSTYSIIITTIIGCILVLMPLKMFKLKLTFNRSQSWSEWILYIITLGLLFFFQFLAMPLIVFSYIVISIVNHLIYGKKLRIS